jgi:hypothetical protein
MTIALDCGAYELRSLRNEGTRLVARRCRTVASIMPDNPARRRWLTSANMAYLVAEEHLILPGDAGIEGESVAGAIPRELLPGGRLPDSDPVARQTIAALVDGLLPWSSRPREICCFTHPQRIATTNPDDEPTDDRYEFISRLIRLRGYEPVAVNSGTALVLSGLASSGFTGVGLTLGASGCEAAVVHRGNEIAAGRIELGGHWIDEQVARQLRLVRRDPAGYDVLDLEAARGQKEHVSLESPAGDVGELVADLYRRLLDELALLLSDVLNSQAQIANLPQPLPVICCGGPAKIGGFRQRLLKALEAEQFPVRLAELNLAGDMHTAIARGCLIRAEIEQAAPSRARREDIRTPHSALARG